MKLRVIFKCMVLKEEIDDPECTGGIDISSDKHYPSFQKESWMDVMEFLVFDCFENHR